MTQAQLRALATARTQLPPAGARAVGIDATALLALLDLVDGVREFATNTNEMGLVGTACATCKPVLAAVKNVDTIIPRG